MAPRVAFWVDRHVGREVCGRSAGGVMLNESEITGPKLKKNVKELRRAEAERWLSCRGCRNLSEFTLKGTVKRATFFFNLPRNIVALQVETLCCAYYHVCDQLISQQNTVLQVEATCCTK